MQKNDQDHAQVFEIEKGNVTPPQSEKVWHNYPDEKRKAILRKMDIRILPVVMLLYSTSVPILRWLVN